MVFWSLVESIAVIRYMTEILRTEKKDGIPCVIIPCLKYLWWNVIPKLPISGLNPQTN